MLPEPLLSVKNLTKRFGNVVANDTVSLELARGEIHCLLGENGAGKSTLCECLYGYYRPDSGIIELDGKPVSLHSPSDAVRLGIGMVHQHFVLVAPLTVLENIIVGASNTGLLLDLKTAAAKISELCRRYGLTIDLHARIWQLSVGEQQWVEILKALYLGARVLILDEPTAVLTPQESDKLFSILRQMAREGLAILLITHKLNEVMQADRVTVLRKGRYVATLAAGTAGKEDLSRMMVGRKVLFHISREAVTAGDPVLEINNLCALKDKGQTALQNLSLTVNSAEIVGIAGVAGNGQKELFEVLVGMRRATAGTIRLQKQEITYFSARRIMDAGVGHIPEDRFGSGLIGEFSVAENLILGKQHSAGFRRGPLLDFTAIKRFAARCMADFDIAAPSAATAAKTLSGGNAQKVILARELNQCTSLLLANQPTRGLDVGVIEYVHKQLLAKRREGLAILLASEELEDIFNLADRIVVMYKGQIMGSFRSDEADLDTIGLLMAGGSAAAETPC